MVINYTQHQNSLSRLSNTFSNLKNSGNVKIIAKLEGLFLGLICWGLAVVCISVFPIKALGALVAGSYGIYLLCDKRIDSQT